AGPRRAQERQARLEPAEEREREAPAARRRDRRVRAQGHERTMGRAAGQGRRGPAAPRRRGVPAALSPVDGAVLPAREPAAVAGPLKPKDPKLPQRLLHPAAAVAAALLVVGANANASRPLALARDDQAKEASVEAYGDLDHLHRARRVVDRALAFLERRIQA